MTEEFGEPKEVTFNVKEGDMPPIAVLHLTEDGQVFLSWLPEIFSYPGGLPKSIREEIVEKLRYHADKLESGEMDLVVQAYKGTKTCKAKN